jgi:7,8-dihydropterin-6-yl-methyl-4-(beta-D-ribofuranosyl)aminobenzene 5'-phosphate synthase
MKKIICVVDNTVQRSSQYWGEHGLAFWIETDEGCVLFDTGRSGSVLLHNLEVLKVNPYEVSAIILSHAHNDHTGGLTSLLSQKPGLPLYASPDLFRSRFSCQEGRYQSIGLSVDREVLAKLADLRLSDVSVEVLPGLWTTGEIVDRPEPEGRSPHHFIRTDNEWESDLYQDDMSLVWEVSEGLVVIFGCCHAGLLNTLAQIKKNFQRPILAVLGGTHLVAAPESYLNHVVSVLREEYDSPQLYLNHCTGENAYVVMVNSFGNRVKPCPVGTILTFDS